MLVIQISDCPVDPYVTVKRSDSNDPNNLGYLMATFYLQYIRPLLN